MGRNNSFSNSSAWESAFMGRGAGSKTLSPEELEPVRRFVGGLVQEHFQGNQTNAAKAWGMKQPQLSKFLAGTEGLGIKSLILIAKWSRTSLDTILSLSIPAVGVVAEPDEHYPKRGLAIAMLRGTAPERVLKVVKDAYHSEAEGFSEWDWIRTAADISNALDGELSVEKIFPGKVAEDRTKPRKLPKGKS